MKKLTTILSITLILATSSLAVHAGTDQLVSGAGPSTKIVQLFFDQFSTNPACEGYTFMVPKLSVKHKGGILSSNDYLFGRTGRPLNAKEIALGKGEIFLAKVPITFAVGLETKISSLGMSDIEMIFTGKISNWNQLGGPDADIVLVGRESTEALFSVLKSDHPFFKNVKFDQIFKKDHEVVKFLTSPGGRFAIGFGAKPNFPAPSLITSDDLASGVSLGLVYDQKNADHKIIVAAKDYAHSADWKKLVQQADLLPAD